MFNVKTRKIKKQINKNEKKKLEHDQQLHFSSKAGTSKATPVIYYNN